jgi:hypothetical protein
MPQLSRLSALFRLPSVVHHHYSLVYPIHLYYKITETRFFRWQDSEIPFGSLHEGASVCIIYIALL